MALRDEFFKICKVLLLYGGISSHHMTKWSRFSQKLFKIFSLSCQIFYVCCLPLISVEMVSVFGTDMKAATAAMKSITFVIVIVAKTFIVQSKNITKLLESASNEELNNISSPDPEIKKIHRTHVKYCNTIVLVIVICQYMSGVLKIAGGLYRSYHFYKTHPNITDATLKPLPIQMWFPFNKNKYHKIAMAYDVFHIAQTLNYNGAAQALMISMLIFLKDELKILQHKIRSITPDGTADNSNKKISPQIYLKNYAKEHQNLVRWVDEFNGSFQYIILLEYCVASLTLATSLIDILQGRDLAFNAVFFSMNTLQLFTLAWNANEILLESSSGVSDALYECAWYNLDKSTKTPVLIMIMRCSKPLKIAIGPFGVMTIEAAVSRMKLAYSVLSVLSTSSN